MLIAAIAAFALMLWSSALAMRIGLGLGKIVSRLLGLVHKPPTGNWGNAAVGFRAGAIDLLRHRWLRLTVATIVSHLSLFFVLLLALRHMDVSIQQVSWAEALGAFALIRLVTALPITPGGSASGAGFDCGTRPCGRGGTRGRGRCARLPLPDAARSSPAGGHLLSGLAASSGQGFNAKSGNNHIPGVGE